MKRKGRILLALIAAIVLSAAIAAVLLHSPHLQHYLAGLHGGTGIHASGPAATLVGNSGGDPAVNARAREGVAEIGGRWDEAAFEQTAALYTAVHRAIEWPGVLPAEAYRYGAEAHQTLDLYRPEQEFSEPGPVFLFLPGDGLGLGETATANAAAAAAAAAANVDTAVDAGRVGIVAGSDGLIYSHLGKLAATAGGFGVLMNYQRPSEAGDRAALEPGARDLRLAIEWIVANIADYGGDPGTIVVVAHSEGATAAAGYLFDSDRQMAQGHGVAAAILVSGRFGELAPAIEPMVIEYAGARVPLALWVSEYDVPAVSAGIADLYELLCRKYQGCPWYEQIGGHNHVSQLMSLGTADTDVMNRFIRFYHTVR